jgi:hypothetical protein
MRTAVLVFWWSAGLTTYAKLDVFDQTWVAIDARI